MGAERKLDLDMIEAQSPSLAPGHICDFQASGRGKVMVDDVIVSDPEILWGMPAIKGTRVPVHELAASVKAGIPRDRILAAYPTIQEHYLELAVAYAEANPLGAYGTRTPRGGVGSNQVSGRCFDMPGFITSRQFR